MKVQRHPGFRERIACVICTSAAVLVSVGHADDWSLKPEVKDTPYQFGKARVVLHYDSMKNRAYPEYTLKIYQGEELLGEHKAVGFEQVFADAENRYFLGVSNKGLTRTAWVVFDRAGRIIKAQAHGAGTKYCQMSVSLVRTWYDEKKPEPQFKVEGGKLKEVSLRSCEGKRIALPLAEEGKQAP